MADYIEREAAHDLVRLLKKYSWTSPISIESHETVDAEALHELLDFIPAADVVEVVRCRDCKHFTEGMAIGMCKRIEDKPILPINANHFCSYGKKRKEKENA